LRSGWVGGAQPVCEGNGLAGGQVVDGDFVSLPVGAGEEDVATDGDPGSSAAPCRRKRHCCITIAIQAPQAAALGYVDATFQDGEARRWPIYSHGDGTVLLLWGEVYGGFFERFTIQGVDPDAGGDCTLFFGGTSYLYSGLSAYTKAYVIR
jgi:hypothetical protein